jgi:uncharacterized protein (TIGR02444 family)
MIGDAHPFHRFARAVYNAEGVSPASIFLQDRCHVDVNVVLLAAYVGAILGGSFDVGDVAKVHGRVGAWQSDVVVPLRGVRRRLKAGPPPAPSPATEGLRERLKALELEAEVLELDVLARFADELDVTVGTGDANHRAAAAMTAVLEEAAAFRPDDEAREAIALIAFAAALYGERAR